jgi:hypothetical protein
MPGNRDFYPIFGAYPPGISLFFHDYHLLSTEWAVFGGHGWPNTPNMMIVAHIAIAATTSPP